MEHKIRSLNEAGIKVFSDHLNLLRFNQTNTSFDRSVLEDEKFTVDIKGDATVDERTFSEKIDFAKFITDRLGLQKNKHHYFNIGLWTWLSAFYFDQVCPLQDGLRKPGQDARHILQEPKNYKVYYRHLLAGPARIYTELGDRGRILLAGELAKRGDIVEQFQAYQNIGLNKGIIEAADRMYWDEKKNKIKRGVGSKGPGSPRRFVTVIGQFELTYDLNSMKAEEILALLPIEFSKWTNE